MPAHSDVLPRKESWCGELREGLWLSIAGGPHISSRDSDHGEDGSISRKTVTECFDRPNCFFAK